MRAGIEALTNYQLARVFAKKAQLAIDCNDMMACAHAELLFEHFGGTTERIFLQLQMDDPKERSKFTPINFPRP